MPIYSLRYSIPYVAVFFMLLFSAYREYKLKKRSGARILTGFIFVFFIGLRGFVAYDWMNYYPMFENMSNMSIADLFDYVDVGVDGEVQIIEPGFLAYMLGISKLSGEYAFFVLISSLLDFVVIDYFFCRYSTNYSLSVLVFFALSLSAEFDLMRNMKAIMVFIIAIRFIEERKLLPFLLLSVIGISFHKTYLFFLPFYFIGEKVISKKIWYILIVVSIVIYVLQIPLAHMLLEVAASTLGGQFLLMFDAYSGTNYASARGLTLGFFIRLLMFVIVMYRYDVLMNSNRYRLFFTFFLVSIITNLALTDFSVFANRITILMSFSSWIVYPLIVNAYYKNKHLIEAFIIMYCLYSTISLTSNGMYEYENMLFPHAAYSERISSHRPIVDIIMDK